METLLCRWVFHPTVRVDLPAPGEWVELKSALSRGDEEKRLARLASARSIGPDGKQVGDIDPGVIYEVAMSYTLQLALVAWSFDLPITPENIGHLDDASYDRLREEVHERYQIRSGGASQAKNSGGNGPTQRSTAGTSRRN